MAEGEADEGRLKVADIEGGLSGERLEPGEGVARASPATRPDPKVVG
jgi:hypothetical protein